jgi:threonine dehydrogenase-like Zn-dependent dehydrogenase
MAVLGVVLAVVAAQLAKTSLSRADDYALVVGIGVLGVATNLGAAFLVGAAAHLVRRRVA